MKARGAERGFVGDAATVATRQGRGRRACLSGAAAEDSVARDYERRGLVPVTRRWRGGGGEIDLVFRDGTTVVFVEVKSSSTFERAAESLRAAQKRRIWNAAEAFLAGEPAGQDTELRIDLALVDGTGAVRVVENALAHF